MTGANLGSVSVGSSSRLLDASAVEATRRIARHLLQVESGLDSETPGTGNVPTTQLLRSIRRHRLSTLLAPHAGALGLPGEAADALRKDGRRQRLAALRLAALTAQVNDTLASAGIRVMFLKGVALAMLTTGDLTARGAGDIDVLVHPDDSLRAVHALAAAGWARRSNCPAPAPTAGNPRWRYWRWATYEMQLTGFGATVDLHWHPTDVRSSLPGFDALWQRRASVNVGNHTLDTMSASDALAHSCSHSLKHQWSDLRGLVDVNRLLRTIGGPDSPDPRSASVAIGLTAPVVDALIGTPPQAQWPRMPDRRVRRALATAARAQRLAGTDDNAPVSIRRTLAWHRHAATTASEASDYSRILANALLPATSLVDPGTGDWLPLPRALRQRAADVTTRIRRGDRST